MKKLLSIGTLALFLAASIPSLATDNPKDTLKKECPMKKGDKKCTKDCQKKCDKDDKSCCKDGKKAECKKK